MRVCRLSAAVLVRRMRAKFRLAASRMARARHFGIPAFGERRVFIERPYRRAGVVPRHLSLLRDHRQSTIENHQMARHMK